MKAVLAKDWCSDVDIYTTSDEAIKVRSWIVKNWGQVLIRHRSFYSNVHTQSESILIVEKYTTMPIDNTQFLDNRTGEPWTFERDLIYKESIPVVVSS